MSSRQNKCSKCHQYGHNARTCRLQNKKCSLCKEPGHYKPSCPGNQNKPVDSTQPIWRWIRGRFVKS